MLKEILSISGKPGLFKLISQGKNMYIAESLTDGRRIPVYARDKVISLGDIAIYTETEEIPLGTVLDNIKIKEEGNSIDMKAVAQPAELRAYFEQILPDYDKDRVYPSDMKKVLNWYNLLLAKGLTDFTSEEDEKTDEESVAGEEKAEVAEENKD